MLDRLRQDLRITALGPALVIWGFGYVLVDIFAFLLGRSTPGANLLSNIPLFILGVTYTVLIDTLRQRLGRRHAVIRFLVLALVVVVASIVHTLTDLYWLRWLALNLLPAWRGWAVEIDLQRIFTVGLLYMWTFCLAITLLWATRVGQAAERSAKRAIEFEAASHRAEAAALRLQLNPHFLFNALNSISSLVTVDRKQDAEEMIGQLSDFLRASLVSDPMADVSLGDEIATIEAYLNIESARFGSRMEVDIVLPEELVDINVPTFILQPLVENAVKHGVAASRSQTTISVTAEKHFDELVLCVINHTDGVAAAAETEPAVAASTGIGIANIRQRLAITYGETATLETEPLPNGYRAMIRIPFPRKGQGTASRVQA